jgi:hemerythrin superfamily protein
MPTLTREQVDRVLQSVEYPADRDAILEQARRRRAGQALRSALEQLPTQSYDSPAKARKQLEKIEPALKQPTRRRRASSTKEAAQQAEGQQLPLPEPVRQAADNVRVRGSRMIAMAGEQIAQQADQRRATASDSLLATSRAIRESSSQLQERQPSMAQALDVAAGGLESAARYVQRTDARRMLSQLQEAGRRQPLAVLAIGALAGLVSVRLLKTLGIGQLASQAGGGQTTGRTDAVALLEADHRELRRMLRRSQSAAIDARADSLKELKSLLQSHERMEEEVFYPALQKNPATREIVQTNYAEHRVVDEILGEIEATDPADKQWSARFSAMKGNLEEHATEEETELFPLVRQTFTAGELRELGVRMSQIKQASEAVPA